MLANPNVPGVGARPLHFPAFGNTDNLTSKCAQSRRFTRRSPGIPRTKVRKERTAPRPDSGRHLDAGASQHSNGALATFAVAYGVGSPKTRPHKDPFETFARGACTSRPRSTNESLKTAGEAVESLSKRL
ncbi:hypothetical protein V8D89_014802 [Ganoderma adspersum]